MAYSYGNNGLIIYNGTMRYYGKRIPNPPGFTDNNHNVTQINNKLYINGWEWTGNTWKRSLKAIWYKFF